MLMPLMIWPSRDTNIRTDSNGFCSSTIKTTHALPLTRLAFLYLTQNNIFYINWQLSRVLPVYSLLNATDPVLNKKNYIQTVITWLVLSAMYIMINFSAIVVCYNGCYCYYCCCCCFCSIVCVHNCVKWHNSQKQHRKFYVYTRL